MPSYEGYQQATSREIPIVIIELSRAQVSPEPGSVSEPNSTTTRSTVPSARSRIGAG
jgi:hypothetical protein